MIVKFVLNCVVFSFCCSLFHKAINYSKWLRFRKTLENKEMKKEREKNNSLTILSLPIKQGGYIINLPNKCCQRYKKRIFHYGCCWNRHKYHRIFKNIKPFIWVFFFFSKKKLNFSCSQSISHTTHFIKYYASSYSVGSASSHLSEAVLFIMVKNFWIEVHKWIYSKRVNSSEKECVSFNIKSQFQESLYPASTIDPHSISVFTCLMCDAKPQ